MIAGDGSARPPGGSTGEVTVVERALQAAPRLGHVRLVCIDGPAGSGKTTTAESVARLLAQRGAGVAVVHLDDLYEGWRGLEGTLWQRLSEQVLEPLRAGRPGRFHRYDWAAGAFADWVDVPVVDVLVLEGCGSARRAADGLASLRVWVEAPAGMRLARWIARDGDGARSHWSAWAADEHGHFARERTRRRADLLLDGEGRLVDPTSDPDDPARGPAGLA